MPETELSQHISMSAETITLPNSGSIRFAYKVAAGLGDRKCSGRFGRQEIKRIQKIVEENQDMLLGEWDEFFNE